MYAPASFKAARRETPAGRFFSGVDFSGEIPYHEYRKQRGALREME